MWLSKTYIKIHVSFVHHGIGFPSSKKLSRLSENLSVKMSFIYLTTKKVIILSMALHLASLWNRGLEQLANGVLFCSCLQLTSIEVNSIITYEMFSRRWWFVTLTSWSHRSPSLFTKNFKRKTGILLGELISWQWTTGTLRSEDGNGN